MSLPLSPAMLAAAYEYLRTTPPFRAWHLPHADEVNLAVTRHRSLLGTHQGSTEGCSIEVSTVTVGHTQTLLQTLGHEMIHLRQYLAKEETAGAVHNADFRRKAAVVCRYHGWDVRIFV